MVPFPVNSVPPSKGRKVWELFSRSNQMMDMQFGLCVEEVAYDVQDRILLNEDSVP